MATGCWRADIIVKGEAEVIRQLATAWVWGLLMLPAAGWAAESDPFEGVNRVTYKFNDAIDKVLLKPIARGYQRATPAPVRNMVGNFFGNLGEVRNLVNNMLQGKVDAGFVDAGRLLVNTTIGVGGLFDPASRMGLEESDEDFGQTFRVWGWGNGPYLVIPFLGPSTLVDLAGRPFDAQLNPLRELHPVDHRNTLIGTDLIHTRAELLAAERAAFGDRYIFLREAYLQRRAYVANDGQVADDFDDF